MYQPVKKKYCWFKVVTTIFFALLVFVFCISFYISRQLKPLIKKELKNLVKNATNELYNMDYAEVSINFFNGSVTIDRVDISTVDSVYQQMIANKKAPNNLYHIQLQQIKIKRLHLFRLYFKKTVLINAIEFNNPRAEIINKRFEFNENKPPRPEQSPYEVISKLFKSVRVRQIDFINAHVKYINRNQVAEELDSVKNLYVTLKDWLIDKNSAKDTTRMYLLKDINVYINNYQFATPDSMYYLKINQLNVAAASGIVKVKNFEIEPRYAQGEFQKINGYAKNRFVIKMDDIIFNKLNFPTYVKKREIRAGNMQISNGVVAVSNNNTYPYVKKNRTGRFPQQILQKLKTLVLIDTIYLNNINLSYEEFNRRTQTSGKITFDNTAGYICNVTNVAKAKAKNHKMEATLQSDVMGKGPLNIRFDFDLTSQTGDFAYKGELKNLDLRKLNQIAKPLGFLQIKKGFLNTLSFDITANQNVAKGTLDFKYQNLSVAIFTRNKDSVSIERRALLSWFANAFVLHTDNPNARGEYTSAVINYQRNPTASFFNFVWKSLFQGIKYSIGFSPQTEAKIKAEMAQLKYLKKERMQRKAARKKASLLQEKEKPPEN